MKTSATFASLFYTLSAFTSLVHGFVYPSSPITETVWKPNTNVTISWTDDTQAPRLSSKPVFDIFLMTGSDDEQIKLATIATDVEGGSTTSISYLVPHVSPPGRIYFLMFQTKDGEGMAWATRFTITDAKGNPGTLKPVIPPGGKINPGGVGTIVSAPAKHHVSPSPQVEPSAPKSSAAVSATPSKATSVPNMISSDNKDNSAGIAVDEKSQIDTDAMGARSDAPGSMSSAMTACAGAVLGFAVLMAF
ncbi:hypothetical protein BGZ51_002988 [Haplosporangium sp. Z 767]|nr:hypothetical protein BGZ51_002988 [Haplosporangium sp. Z 767]KAF9188635.1 hypothetical protein BGZ50_001214 [Haplosporangium sp. Z 11]